MIQKIPTSLIRPVSHATPSPRWRTHLSAHPLAIPAWIVAVCIVLWTITGAVWLIRIERAMSAASNAMADVERKQAARREQDARDQAELDATARALEELRNGRGNR